MLINQFVPLLGEHGLLPFTRYIRFVPFSSSPSLFYFLRHDVWLRVAAWVGVGLAVAVVTTLPQRGGAVWAASAWGRSMPSDGSRCCSRPDFSRFFLAGSRPRPA